MKSYLIFGVMSMQNALIFFLSLCLLVILLVQQGSNGGRTIFDSQSHPIVYCPKETLLMGVVPDTAKGFKTYGELLQFVYEPFGYEYDEVEGKNCSPNSILFPLKYKTLNCPQVFLDWLSVQITSNITTNSQASPPAEIPANLNDRYLLNGFAWLRNWYFDETPAHLPQSLIQPWTQDLLRQYFVQYNDTGYDWNSLPYGSECAALFFALKHFKPTGQTGLVIGSQTPWAEAMALFHEAEKVITVEYAQLIVEVFSIEYIHPVPLVKNWERYTNMDFVISFSSIEHSGLGRYGDPPDPIGDFRELSKIICLLKQGGLLYLGLPSGPDTIEYNAHRIYGYIRWPMIAAGFEFVGAFHMTNTMFTTPPPILSTDWHKQYLFVLRKK